MYSGQPLAHLCPNPHLKWTRSRNSDIPGFQLMFPEFNLREFNIRVMLFDNEIMFSTIKLVMIFGIFLRYAS